jgi:two-component system cell cycle sensor histidine kinase/response regulator CckA
MYERGGSMPAPLRVLILEDNSARLRRIQRQLQGMDLVLDIHVAGTKQEFVDNIQQKSPEVVISDYTFPGFNGQAVLRAVKKADPKTPLIFLSDNNPEKTVWDSKDETITIITNAKLSQLRKTVNKMLETRNVSRDRKTTEQALLISEIRYRRLFESAQEGIILIDAENKKIMDINPFMLNLINYKREEILDKELWEVGIFQDQNSFNQVFEKFNTEGHVYCEGMVLQTKGSEHINIEMNCNNYLVQNKWVIQCNIRDISERKKAEEEREKMRAQLFQAQKMEAIGTLAGGVAHDFNNLMTAIQVSTDVAMMKASDGELANHELQEIREAALRASSLIRQLLLFSRKHLMEFTAININISVENLLRMLHRLIGEDIVIQTALPKDIQNIRADVGNIEQVIMNLALNARDAMPQGGELKIVTENVAFGMNIRHQIPEARGGHFVCLTVTDTGIGMDPETLSRIFEPFFTTKESHKGTGLGLSVVYGIVKQHEGWITVESQVGHGSTFKIYFPVAEEEVEMMESDHESVQMLKGRGEKILIVEDEDKVREFTARAIKKCGYQVFSARSVKEAIEVYDKEGCFDLVFSDVVLADQTGIELADELIRRKPDIRVLLCSGYMDHKSQWPLIRQKGYAFIQKPYALSELLQAIKETAKRENS